MGNGSASTAIERIVQILQDSLTPEGIDQWLWSRNRILGGRRPIDLIKRAMRPQLRRPPGRSLVVSTSDRTRRASPVY
jgi:hypothetical protein